MEIGNWIYSNEFDSETATRHGFIIKDPEVIKSLESLAGQVEAWDVNEKEFEIIKLVAEGLNNKEIAGELYLSEGTVRNYLSTILEKLNLRDRTQLACFYYKHI